MLAHETSDADRDARVLRDTYETMRRLQEEGRNHIWGYVARNLARPVWLASEAQKADVVIGNPPWVSYRYMRGDFKARFRQESRAANLWVGGKVATQQDLSSYFYLRAAGLYLRRGGRLAMIVPYAALSRQSYAPFRTGAVARFGQPVFRLRFTQAWAFGPEVTPLFPVPSCVLFAEVHPDVAEPRLPATIRAFSGTLPKRDADVAEAETNLTETATPWPTIAAADADGSPYRKIFQNGATLFPRRLVLVDLVSPSGRLPPNPEFPLVRGRTGSQDKAPWKTVPPPEGTVEKRFLRPILLGDSIAPFRIVTQPSAVIPWDAAEGGPMNAAQAAQRGYRKLAQWLEKTEALWTRHKHSTLGFLEQLDYYRKLSGQFPIAPMRVVYTKSGTNPAACFVQDETAAVDSQLYWAPVETREEAQYLCAILNSETLRAGVQHYQARGQWGARHFDKYVFNLPIPRFESGKATHRALADAGQTAADVAHTVPFKAGEYFTRTRKRIRTALAEHGVAAEIDRLTAHLLDAAA